MTFKEQARRDIDTVFFNTTEFADIYNVDGREIYVMQDDDRILEDADLTLLAEMKVSGRIFVKEKEMPFLPMANQELTINGRKWYVHTAISNAGVLELLIGRTKLYDIA